MSAATYQLVIIERDGVISERVPGDVATAEQLAPLPGSLEAIARLNHSGMRIAVTVKHAHPAARNLPIETLNQTHARLQQLLARRGGHLDGLFIHDPDESLPKQDHARELVEDIAARFSIPLEQTAVVCDDPDLVQGALDCGATAILVRADTADLPLQTNLRTAANLLAAADDIAKS